MAIGIGILLYPDAQMSAVLGMTDLFLLAADIAGQTPAVPHIHVQHLTLEDGVPHVVFSTDPATAPPGRLEVLILPPSLAKPIAPDAAAPFKDWLRACHADGTVLASVNASGVALADHPVTPARLGALIRLEATGEVSNTAARQLFTLMEREDLDPLALATREGLRQVRDDQALVGWIDYVLAENPAEAARFLAGEKKLQGVLVGLVMKKSKGSADPRLVNQLLSARAG